MLAAHDRVPHAALTASDRKHLSQLICLGVEPVFDGGQDSLVVLPRDNQRVVTHLVPHYCGTESRLNARSAAKSARSRSRVRNASARSAMTD